MMQALCGDTSFIHAREKLFSCEECGQRFKHSLGRAVHMRTVHPTEQTTLHQCPHCPYSTNYGASTLRQHIRTHTGENAILNVRSAGQRFTQSGARSRHIRTMHSAASSHQTQYYIAILHGVCCVQDCGLYRITPVVFNIS